MIIIGTCQVIGNSNGRKSLDVKGIDISQPDKIESLINNIPGVVDNGIFAFNKPNIVFVSD